MLKDTKGSATGKLLTIENPREQITWFLQEKIEKEGKEIKGVLNSERFETLANSNIWTLFRIQLKQFNKK